MHSSHSLIHIPEALIQHLNNQAIELLSEIRPEAPQDVNATTNSDFKTTLLIGAVHIDGREHPANCVKTITSFEGTETARYFALGNNENWVGFAGDTFDAFIFLCRQLYDVETVAHHLSFSAVVESGFEWFRQSHIRSSDSLPGISPFTTTVVSTCEADIDSYEVWVPVTGVAFTDTFQLGRVMFKNVSPADVDRWMRKWEYRWQSQNHPRHDYVNSYFLRFQSQVRKGELAVGTLALQAEPVRAVELALIEIDEALAVLRFFSQVNSSPLTVSKCAIEGSLPDESSRYLLLQSNSLSATGRVSEIWPHQPPEQFSSARLAQMRASGMRTLNRILCLEPSQRTPFERQLLKAITIYTKATLMRDPQDKLLYIVVALESIFVQGNQGALRRRVAERMAFLLGQSLTERTAIIDIYYQAYEARSNLVHRGEAPTDIEMLRKFMSLAWHTFKHLVDNVSQYNSKDELIEKLDEIKFM